MLIKPSNLTIVSADSHHPALPGGADGNKPLGLYAYVGNEGFTQVATRKCTYGALNRRPSLLPSC